MKGGFCKHIKSEELQGNSSRKTDGVYNGTVLIIQNAPPSLTLHDGQNYQKGGIL